MCVAMSAPQLFFNGGIIAPYTNHITPRVLLPASPYAYATGYDIIHSYEPVEQHGYKISY